MDSLKACAKKVLLVILDGFGHSQNTLKNAVNDATTPTLDQLFANYPFTPITPGGEAVGLPKGVQGNSEVGHMNLGAGRPVRQDLVRINEAIANNAFFEREKLQELIEVAKANSGKIHLMGLLSDGGVHSHIDHLKEVIKILSPIEGVKLYFHAFMDGRDTPKTNGIKYLKELLTCEGFTLSSMQGRSIGMDRDRRWEKIHKAYSMMTGQTKISALSPIEFIEKEYSQDIYDEFITPVLFESEGAVGSDDCVFFCNFRPDRAKQIGKAFMDPKFSHFKRDISPTYWLCMTPYFETEELTLPILFDKEKIGQTLSEHLSNQDVKQFKIAETEKYAHVTYFFNGGKEAPFSGEEHHLINSPKEVATYDLKPEMSAPLVLEKLLQKLSSPDISFYLVNFANADMVGHTGNYQAALKAVETLDNCVDQLMQKCLEEDVVMILTADHGNSDQMVYEDGTPHTAHTKALVPCVLFGKNIDKEKVSINGEEFALKDVAPTVLHLLGIDPPKAFSGKTIFI